MRMRMRLLRRLKKGDRFTVAIHPGMCTVLHVLLHRDIWSVHYKNKQIFGTAIMYFHPSTKVKALSK